MSLSWILPSLSRLWWDLQEWSLWPCGCPEALHHDSDTVARKHELYIGCTHLLFTHIKIHIHVGYKCIVVMQMFVTSNPVSVNTIIMQWMYLFTLYLHSLHSTLSWQNPPIVFKYTLISMWQVRLRHPPRSFTGIQYFMRDPTCGKGLQHRLHFMTASRSKHNTSSLAVVNVNREQWMAQQ